MIKTLKRLLGMCLGPWDMVILIVLELLNVAKDLAGVITLAYATDQIMSGGNGTAGIAWMALAMLVGVPIAAAERYQIEKIRIGARKRILTGFEKKLLSVQLEAVDRMDLGEILSQYNSDTEKILRWFDYTFPRTFNLLFYLAGALTYSFSQNWILTLTIAPAVAILTPLLMKIVSQFGIVVRKERKISDRIMKKLSELFFGAELIKSFSLEDSMEEQAKTNLTEKEEQDQKAEWYQGLTKAVSLLISYLPGILAGIAGGIFLQNGLITVGFLIAFIQMMMGRISYSFPQISEYITNAKESAIYGERIFAFLDLSDESPNLMEPSKEDLPLGQKDFALSSAGGKMIPLDNHAPYIEFSHVSFAYEGRDTVLKDLSFSIQEGESVALVGVSGCGKSTILKLIMGYYASDYLGSIRIRGREMRNWDLGELRIMMAPVFQQNHVFSGTVRKNLELVGGRKEDINEISAMLKLPAEIMDREAGEKGVMLSGGQKQRVAIARGFLKDAELYLLDEPLANLDNITEDRIMTEISDVLRAKTVVMVEHRLKAASRMDRILFIENGCVAEEGTHDQLMQKQGSYYQLYIKQTKEEGGKIYEQE